jgi:hypothetical protein
VAAAIGAVAGVMSAPMVYRDPDMIRHLGLTIEPMIRAWSPSKLCSTGV